MPRKPTLLPPFLMLAALCCAHAAAARAQEQVEMKPRPAAEADALKAASLCEQARAHAAAGREGAGAAPAPFAQAVKLYLRIYQKERPPAPSAGPAALAAFRAQLREWLAGAPRCVDDYLALGLGTPFERAQLEAFRGQAQMISETDESRTVLIANEMDTRARILYKPHPGFTEEARRNDVRGRVRLRAVLAADGTVRHVLVLEGLPHGMTEECVAAARAIRFTPAVKNGRPASQFVVLEYNFNTH
ncbi:MAG: energy transducer TonB [Pyrinomonadaceae bacterium]